MCNAEPGPSSSCAARPGDWHEDRIDYAGSIHNEPRRRGLPEHEAPAGRRSAASTQRRRQPRRRSSAAASSAGASSSSVGRRRQWRQRFARVGSSAPALLLLLPLLLAAIIARPCAAQAPGVHAPGAQAAPAPDEAARARANAQLEALNALPAAAAAAPKLQHADEAPRITIEEQLQQAEALGVALTQEQLARANPLLGTAGRLKDPERKRPADWPDGYFAICAIIKNQHGTDLREWIEYHRYIGTRKIYIYDNNSTEPLANHIGDYLHSGLVEYAYFVGHHRFRDLFRTTSQWWAYNDCATRFATRHRWLAFIDGDEFIVFRNASRTRDIEEFLTDYEPYGGLALNWVIFGSSGHLQRPHGGVLVNYQKCLPGDQLENNHVKIVANTRHLLTVGDDPHTAFYRTKGAWTVNELGARVAGAKTEAPSHTKIALYHYLTKSRAEFEAKIKRGSAAGNYKNMGFFEAIEELANATCSDAVPLGLRCCPSVHHDMAVAAERAQAAAAGVLPDAGGGGAGGAGGAGAPAPRVVGPMH